MGGVAGTGRVGITGAAAADGGAVLAPWPEALIVNKLTNERVVKMCDFILPVL